MATPLLFTFIQSYFAAFRPRSLPALLEPSTGNNALILALEAGNYLLTFVNESLDQCILWGQGRAKALNLHGTF
ncbi:hypothetical protein C0991_010988, partial [Blastosporella zonata]